MILWLISMLKIARTSQFKRDYKRELRGSHKNTLEGDLKTVLTLLVQYEPLDEKYKDHALTGNWKDHRDCHIKPDLILIYRVEDNVLRLARIGSHSELGI